MPPTNHYRIPEEISTDDELKVWLDQELEKLGDESSIVNEIELLDTVFKPSLMQISEKNSQFNLRAFDSYKVRLVSALMANGWELKRGSEKSKRLRPDAIRTFEEALRLIPENPKACYRLGHLLKSRGNYGEAIGYFSRALELASKQDDFQEDLKLSAAQKANAGGQAVALLQGLISAYDFEVKPTFDPEQIATLQNLLEQTWYSHVVYLTKVGGSIETKTIDSYEYDHRIVSLKSDPGAFVIDRYNQVSLIRYETKEKKYEQDTLSSGRLNYLLGALRLEAWEKGTVKDNTITKNVHRLNNDLYGIGIDNWVNITYGHEYGERKLTATCDLSVHYFKSLLD